MTYFTMGMGNALEQWDAADGPALHGATRGDGAGAL